MAYKILVLCSKFPYPPKDGGTRAMQAMIQGFHKAGHEVTVLTMNTPKHYVILRTLPEAVRMSAEFYAVDVDTNVKLTDMLANFLFSKQSYHVQRFNSRRFREELQKLLRSNKYDIVQLETLFMAPYIDTIREMNPKAFVSLRIHNIEHIIWQRRAENEDNPIKKLLFEVTSSRMKAYEELVYKSNAYDALIPITNVDLGKARELGAKEPFMFINTGVDLETIDRTEKEFEFPSIFYIGALDWGPNVEGLRWFLKYVWPLIQANYPEVKFYIAGRRMAPDFLKKPMENVVLMGEVDESEPFIKSHAVMVVPLLSGSGLRIKIVEAMAYGKAVVATRIASEGLGAFHGNQILIADDPRDFADCVSVLLEKRSFFDTIATHAKKFVESRFDNNKLTRRLLDFYGREIKNKRSAEANKKE
ncbi:MAG: glycosyltransferase family 4 protein [Bacteroidia bacterium]|nr:glycosyltransferase family 4 protein [Bacteroidia bacterium]